MTDIQANISDATFTKIIDTAIDHPFTVAAFIVLIACVLMAYKRPKEFWSIIKETFTFRIFFRKRVITKEDLLNHQFFKDIKFLLDYKINQLYNQETFKHFDKAKLLMAHDLLQIKLLDVQSWVKDFVENTNFNDPYLNIRSLLKDKLDKHTINIWDKYQKLEIPSLFIEKFTEISKIHVEYLSLILDDFLSEKIPLTIYERVFIILGCLSQYYMTLVIQMKEVIQSINGDLKGLVYKGQVVGGNNYKYYPVPTKEYISIVEKRLQEISLTTRAKRVSIYLFHDYVGDDYLQGNFSKLYEYESLGFSSLISKFQYKAATLLCDVLSKFKQHQGVVAEASELNEIFANLLIENGIVAIAYYPIFLHDSLRGFLALEFNSLDTYNKIDKDSILTSLRKYASLLNIYLDYTKTGFSYSGTVIKE